MHKSSGHDIGRPLRRLGLVAAGLLIVVGGLPNASGAAGSSAGSSTSYVVVRSACQTPTEPEQFRCMALVRVPVAKGTKDAVAVPRPAYAAGPAGGLTPAVLAKAYSYNPALTMGASQTVAIVDWYDNPNVLADLNVFNKHYGLPAETSNSFRKVNQNGERSPLPLRSAETAAEISLDVQVVRAVCNKCKILLIEASRPSSADLAAAENTAARLGANEISNSWGGPETPGKADPTSFSSAFNHPGIVITAATGDDGWYDWDNANASQSGSDAPNTPAAYPTVVAVGGTSLTLTADGARASEFVWNLNGPSDSAGSTSGGAMGASGGGCSTAYRASAFQSSAAGYTALNCAGRRSATDIAVTADPTVSGLDIYLSYGTQTGWVSVGGTSLAAPIVAAMWALAGGAKGVPYPAQALYDHLRYLPSQLYDVTAGGNGFCGGDSISNCYGIWGNPNSLGAGALDCSNRNGSSDQAVSPECNARAGFDGPSGVGAPNGTSALLSLLPTVAMSRPNSIKVRTLMKMQAVGMRDPVPGARIVRYAWAFGDGTKWNGTSPGPVAHTYPRTGIATIVLTVTDNLGRQGTVSSRVPVHN